jgi:hypothetical protein
MSENVGVGLRTCGARMVVAPLVGLRSFGACMIAALFVGLRSYAANPTYIPIVTS